MGLNQGRIAGGALRPRVACQNQPFQSPQHPYQYPTAKSVMPGLKYLHSDNPLPSPKVERVGHPIETQTPNEVISYRSHNHFLRPHSWGAHWLGGWDRKAPGARRPLHTDPRTPWWSKQGKSITSEEMPPMPRPVRTSLPTFRASSFTTWVWNPRDLWFPL